MESWLCQPGRQGPSAQPRSSTTTELKQSTPPFHETPSVSLGYDFAMADYITFAAVAMQTRLTSPQDEAERGGGLGFLGVVALLLERG